MEFNLPPVGGADQNAGPAAAPSRAPAGTDFTKVLSQATDRVDALPATPPPDLRAEIERADARYEELHRENRELHFTSDPSSGRVVIEVRDLDGNVLRTVPPSKALEIVAGAPAEG
jgi:hypothetical protein